jgi:hypothetical protein
VILIETTERHAARKRLAQRERLRCVSDFHKYSIFNIQFRLVRVRVLSLRSEFPDVRSTFAGEKTARVEPHGEKGTVTASKMQSSFVEQDGVAGNDDGSRVGPNITISLNGAPEDMEPQIFVRHVNVAAFVHQDILG